MLTATRSVRVMIGRIPSAEAESSSRFSGNPTTNSAPSRWRSCAILSATSVRSKVAASQVSRDPVP